MVLIHGLGGDATFWSREFGLLEANHRVLSVELRGSGATPGAAAAFRIEDLAADILAVLDRANVGTASLVGFALGGLVAQVVAAAAPQRIDKLVLASSFAVANAHARSFLQAVAEVYCGGATREQVFRLTLPWLVSPRFLANNRSVATLRDFAAASLAERHPRDWLHLLDAQLSFNGHRYLPGIRCPTLVIAGANDALVTPQDSMELVRQVAIAELKVLSGGHLVHLESRDAFWQALQTFLDAPADTRISAIGHESCRQVART